MNKFMQDSDILAMILYGSSLKSSKYHDIDIALVKYPQVKSKSLKFLLQFPEKIDLHFLSEMPLVIAKEAIQGELIFNKDYDLLFDVYLNIIDEWKSFSPYYNLYLECVKHGI